MNRFPSRTVAGLAAATLLVVVGCQGNAIKATFDVSLHNASTQPVTAWLTKSGGPKETDWLAPEDLSLAAPSDKINGVIIPPGKTADIGPIKGRFDVDSMAVLRVYSGSVGLDAMLATGPDSSLRTDVTLREGRNELVVTPAAKLTVEPAAGK